MLFFTSRPMVNSSSSRTYFLPSSGPWISTRQLSVLTGMRSCSLEILVTRVSWPPMHPDSYHSRVTVPHSHAITHVGRSRGCRGMCAQEGRAGTDGELHRS